MSEKIKSYNGDGYFYSGSDEEYNEFLKSVNGKMNTGTHVGESDLGETKTINLQGVIEKFRKRAGDIKDASKKLTAEAAEKIEELKNSVKEETEHPKNEEITAETKQTDACEDVTLDLDDIKREIGDAVQKSMSGFSLSDSDMKSIRELLDGNEAKINALAENVRDIEAICRDAAAGVETMRVKTEGMSGGIEEIRQAISGISKLNDSVFDLKNAQLNVKNSLENLEHGFKGLKKKFILGITILSILTFISIIMSVLLLLS